MVIFLLLLIVFLMLGQAIPDEMSGGDILGIFLFLGIFVVAGVFIFTL